MKIEVVGVYPVEAAKSCHLVELSVSREGGASPLSLVDNVTQEMPSQPRENWQVPWDERFFDPAGLEEVQTPGPDFRAVFFLHYLDFELPLLTPAGPLPLPPATKRPARLDGVSYEPPS